MRRVDLITDDDVEVRLAQHLRAGCMPDPFLYVGDAGARGWLSLDSCKEFPIAVRLQALLERSMSSIVGHVPDRVSLVSLGVGKGEKERLLLDALSIKSPVRYVAVDVSSRMVDCALETSAGIDVDKLGVTAFVEDLRVIRRYWSPPLMLCLLGNNFSNYDPDSLLSLIRRHLRPGDLLLFDCHLLPPGDSGGRMAGLEMEATYGSRQNALFNMGPLLDRGMRVEDCAFRLDLISVDLTAGKVFRTRKWLEMVRGAGIDCGPHRVDLASGSRIELGFTFKYRPRQVMDCLAKHGFQAVESFFSGGPEDMLVLAELAV